MRFRQFICAFLLLTLSISLPVFGNPVSTYVSDYGTGPDKWASVWLIENANQTVLILSENQLLGDSQNAIPFDKHGAAYNRTSTSTTYATLLDGIKPENEASISVGKIIHEIEIDAFSKSISIEARIVEHGFRGMQMRFGRDRVTKACYLHFFDNVADAIDKERLALLNSKELIPNSICMDDRSNMPATEPIGIRVPTLKLRNAFESYAGNDNIIFVDTRETWEFEEGHIPGAINIKLREVEDSLDLVRDADLVIAYCVKDFRGYEAARAFRRHGINAAIIKPHGMRGWIEEGLPVAGSRGLPEAEALATLQELAETATASTQ